MCDGNWGGGGKKKKEEKKKKKKRDCLGNFIELFSQHGRLGLEIRNAHNRFHASGPFFFSKILSDISPIFV